MLSYCLQTVNSSVDAKKPGGYSPGDERLANPVLGETTRQSRGWKEEEVLVRLLLGCCSYTDVQANQLANEESVEAIVRKRTLDGEPLAFLRRLEIRAESKPSKPDARSSRLPLAHHLAVGGI